MNAGRLLTLPKKLLAGLLPIFVAAALSGCSTAHYVVNKKLVGDTAGARPYTFRSMRAPGNSDSMVVVVALSGGGYRAAALAHSVFEVLADTKIHWDGQSSSLIDEVDVVTAVSGGSLAAAYFGLNRSNFLREFPQKVLALDLQSILLQRVLSPSGVWRQTSSKYGRGDLLQEILDEEIFKGQTYADMSRSRPMIYVNATDMRYGQRFEFTQEQFDHLCSDLNSVPVARAVAASMAVPVVLSPITIWNYRSDCPVPLQLMPVSGRAASNNYIHLVDGGLSDNTGLNALLENVAAHGGLQRTDEAIRLRGVRKRVIIFVNAQIPATEKEPDTPHTPGLVRQLQSLVHVPIDRHSDAKILHLSHAIQQWRIELHGAVSDTPATTIDDFHIIEVSLSRANDPLIAEQLRRIPTGLRIQSDQVETLRRFARDSLARNPSWLQLLAELGGDERPTQSAASEP